MDRSKNPDRRTGGADETLPAAPDNPSGATRESLVEEQIRKAQEQGQFDNLPGFGKPLPKDDGYELAGEHWLGNHILKQAGFLPLWLQLRKEIAAERGEVEAALSRYREQARTLDPLASGTYATLRELEENYVQLATAINEKIHQHNDHCPPTQLLHWFPEDAARRGEHPR